MNNNKKYKILFVCLGNICRSPAAEEVMRVLAARAGRAADFELDSAGLIDFHEGELPDERMRRHARQRGYELTHRSRPVRPADFRNFDRILVMDAAGVRRLEQMASSDAERRKIERLAGYLSRYTADAIPDPYYGGPEDFERVLDLLEDACAGLLEGRPSV